MFNERAAFLSASQRFYFAEEFAVYGETNMLFQARVLLMYIWYNKCIKNTY